VSLVVEPPEHGHHAGTGHRPEGKGPFDPKPGASRSRPAGGLGPPCEPRHRSLGRSVALRRARRGRIPGPLLQEADPGVEKPLGFLFAQTVWEG
jgi:hypothetical protein